VVVLEFTSPTRAPLSLFYRLWFDRIVPLLGALAGDSDAYSYLPNSVKRFPAPAGLAAELERAGLCEIRYLITAGGIVVIHLGTVPPEGAGGTR
jgi:demethylmenaquinone methyltransferase / 2-methoxy-6-polyprenyl-1,4-benzoquinol methylase